ncbi:MAG: TetR family transcriptional regulator [Gemmatimonadales bacterium]
MAGRTPTVPAPEGGLAALRRAPTQRRSRERVERLLTAAAGLIADRGSEAMRMSDVAEQAGVPIGSLYQYFPDKAAIIRTLAQRYNAQDRACIEAELAKVRDAAGLRAAFARLIDTYYEMFLKEPVRRDIWSGTQADKALMDIDIGDSRANAALLARVMARLRPRADRAELAASAFLMWHLAGATVRLAVSVGRAEGDALVAAVKRMMLRRSNL